MLFKILDFGWKGCSRFLEYSPTRPETGYAVDLPLRQHFMLGDVNGSQSLGGYMRRAGNKFFGRSTAAVLTRCKVKTNSDTPNRGRII